VTSCPAAPTTASKAAPSWKSEPEDPHGWAREPFKKIEVSKTPSGMQVSSAGVDDITIQGIMKIDKHYYAIINGRTVKTGDRIDEWAITKISRHRVTVRREKEQQTFDIYQGRINRGTK
jgi:hypothetical protein